MSGAGAFPTDKRTKADSGMQITPVSFTLLKVRRWMMQMRQVLVFSFRRPAKVFKLRSMQVPRDKCTVLGLG
jgi:hypothetical protein